MIKRHLFFSLAALMIIMSLCADGTVLSAEEFYAVNTEIGDIAVTESISLEFNNNVSADTATPKNIKLYRDGDEVLLLDTDITVEGNKIIITCEKVPYSVYFVEALTGLSDVDGKTLAQDTFFHARTLSLNSVVDTISSSAFLSAMYLTSDPNHTGDRKSPGTGGNTGWLPWLYASGVYRHYYGKIDISGLEGKTILKAEYNVFMNGNVDIGLYKVEGDFSPGITPYSELPEYGDLVTTAKKNLSNVNYIKLDITDYVNECLAEGKKSLGFMIKQESPWQTVIASESTKWSDGAWAPSLTVEYYPANTFAGVTCSNPAYGETSFPTDANIVIGFSFEPSNFSSDNITLTDIESGEKTEISEDDIILNAEEKTVTIKPDKRLSALTAYEVRIKGVGDMSEDKVIRFRTDKDILASSPVVTVNGIEGGVITPKSEIKVMCTVSNSYEDECDSYVLIAVLYDGNKIVSVDADGMGSMVPKGKHDLSCTFNTGADADENYTVRVYMWNSLGKMIAVK